VLSALADTIIPNGLRNGAPGFSGWVTTAPTTAGTAAALAATVAGSQRFWVQSFNFLETIALRWLAELLNLPGDMQGTLTSGGSVANLIGLGAARQRAFERINRDVARDGLPPTIRWRIYASSEVHHVVTRAAAVLGLGRRAVMSIAVDSAQRLDLNDLQNTLRADRAAGILPVAIVANAAPSPARLIPSSRWPRSLPNKDLAVRRWRWRSLRKIGSARGALISRIERADSIAADPHKWLVAPVVVALRSCVIARCQRTARLNRDRRRGRRGSAIAFR
jgi:aromatic-L-amino-acid decarboxylase